MKKTILAVLVLFAMTSYAANEQWINSTGSGSTYDEAKNNATRNALELAFGTFISSNTVIKDDILQKDEIVGISSGNIKKITEISKTVINGNYCVTLNVLVSPEKLASFVKSHGMVVEYQGASFASNIKIQLMNEKSEKIAIKTLVDYSKLVFSQCFDYELKAKNPYEYMTDAWEIKMDLNVKANKNFDNLYKHIIKTLGSIGLNNEDIETRKSMGKFPYVLVLDGNKFTLRTNNSRIIIWNLFGDDLLSSIGGVRISMEAGKYSRDLKFSSFKLSKNGGDDYLVVKRSGNPTSHPENELANLLYDRNFSFIKIEKDGYDGIFAKFTNDFIMKGENSVEVISNLKGFKVIK